MNGGRVWSWASLLSVVLCRHLVLVVSSLCGLVVVPSFCVLVVVSSSCVVVVVTYIVCHGRVASWSWWLWCGVVVVWRYGHGVRGVNDNDER